MAFLGTALLALLGTMDLRAQDDAPRSGIVALQQPETLPAPKETGPAETAPQPRSTGPVAPEPVAVSEDGADAGCCGGQFLGYMRYTAGRIVKFVTYRHRVDYSCRCCKGGGSCCNPPLYTYFLCNCGYPKQHLPFPPYLGQGMPPVDHCSPGCCAR